MLQKNALIGEPNQAVPVRLDALYHCSQLAVSKGDGGAFLQPAAGIHDAVPQIALYVFQQQHFHSGAAAAGLLSVQPCGQDAGIIDDQAVAGYQVVDDIVKMLVGHLPRFAVKGHQPGMIPLQQGSLCDEFLGKVIIKISFFQSILPQFGS